MDILGNVEGISFVHFDESDVVRHHLVQRIIRAYDEFKTRTSPDQMTLSLNSNGKNGRLATAVPAEQIAAAHVDADVSAEHAEE